MVSGTSAVSSSSGILSLPSGDFDIFRDGGNGRSRSRPVRLLSTVGRAKTGSAGM
jgi:hypothetical protein